MNCLLNILSFRHTPCHADSTGGAYQTAQVTTDAFVTYDMRLTVGERNSLMTAIHARHIAATTTYTFLAVNLREYHRVAIKIVRQNYVLQFLAH